MTQTTLAERLRGYAAQVPAELRPEVVGRLTRVMGLTLEAVGCPMTLGERCLIEVARAQPVEAEVVGFAEDKIYLMPLNPVEGLQSGARVWPIGAAGLIPVGMGLLGRVLNGAGDPLDGKGPIQADAHLSMVGHIINPLHRAPIRQPLDVGIRAINSMLTVGVGQRLGLFAGSGVGKSMLLGMMTRFTTAEITVVGLIGERGREVKEFIEDILGPEGLARSVVVASPADDSPLMRLRASQLTTRIAEHFRDQGKSVLLLMDSLTRYAQAQREIALSLGEPPATKGYPPSVFAKLPALTEGDDQQDPIADAARAILDGHIVLSRRLAEEGHYPAIDVEASISRVMPHVVSTEHMRAAQRFKQLYARYQQTKDLISVGAYTPGADPETDLAIERMPRMRDFLRQELKERAAFDEASRELQELLMSGSKAPGSKAPAPEPRRAK